MSLPRASWRTTLFGAALSILTYWQGVGYKLPATKQEWATMVGSVLLLLFGLSARDAKVSQQEHAEEKVLVTEAAPGVVPQSTRDLPVPPMPPPRADEPAP